MTASQPRSLSSAARSGDETTPIGVPPPFQNVLHAVTADTTGCTPDQHQIALLHSSAVVAHQRTANSLNCKLVTAPSSHVRVARHQLIGFDHRDIGGTRVVSNPQMRWLVASIESSCTWGLGRRRGCSGRCSVSGLPVTNRGPNAKDDSGGVGQMMCQRLCRDAHSD